MFRSWIKAADIIILLAVLLIIVFSVFFLLQRTGEASYVEIALEGQTSIYPLSEDQSITLKTEIGEVVIQIEDHSAAITHSECPDQLCVRMGAISNNGQWAACLPAKVMISISGGKEEELDALSE